MTVAIDARNSILRSVLIASTLVGCAPTMAEIRALKPVHAGTLTGEYRRIARCAADELDARTSWQEFGGPVARNQLIERDDHIQIIGSVPRSGVPIYEVRLAPATTERTDVEVRYNPMYGVSNDTIWPTVQKCGGKR